MRKLSGRSLRIGAGMAAFWLATALLAWFVGSSGTKLVGAKGSQLWTADLAKLSKPDLTQAQFVLASTTVWGMQRDGQPIAPKVEAAAVVEKKIIWGVAATVVRPTQKFLLVVDLETKAITQINEGDKLPDGSKLVKVEPNFYVVRDLNGKKRTVDTVL